MISFIMMAKNEEKYIGEAINSLQKEKDNSWELIVVDDHSTDNTFEIVEQISKSDSRIKIVKNKYKGKVLGTNYGFTLTKGDIIKCIDADDIFLTQEFFENKSNLKEFDAHCHDAFIVDFKLNKLVTYNVNPRFFNSTYEIVLSNIISIPKAFWSFKRDVANKIFPMPAKLPLEDEWISISIKKHAKKILKLDGYFYLYRQHNSQDYGGILNYEAEKVLFRAKRMLKLINVLGNEPRIIEGFEKDIFDNTRVYNILISKEKLSILDVLKSELKFMAQMKIILIRKFPILAKYITILKWKIDAYKR